VSAQAPRPPAAQPPRQVSNAATIAASGEGSPGWPGAMAWASLAQAFAEWLAEADHTGPLVLGEDSVLEATGRHVQLPGITVADFREGKIRSFRMYFDDISLIEQIVGA
jgi:hypothetical protein